MKLSKFIPIALAGISLLGFTSCQNNLEPQIPNQEEPTIEHTRLGDILSNVIASHNNETDGDSYVIYDASTDEFTVMSAEDYALFNALADVIVREETPVSRAPQGNGWIVGGRGKDKSGAIKVAMKLATLLEKNRDFEIHVEYANDGSFTVWYRYV